MKKLSDYQEEYMNALNKQKEGWLDVACDSCGHELKGNRSWVLTSYPPKIRVWCDNCNFTGYMNV
jgi:hypothetical protein